MTTTICAWWRTTCRRSCAPHGCAASRRCRIPLRMNPGSTNCASEAGVDPIEYRLRYLKDSRAIDLVNAVAERAGWKPRPVRQEPEAEGDIVRGRGFAYALYVHSKFPGYGAAWSAWIADVAVNKATGDVSVTRVVAGQDSGLMINPDGVRHQIHGNVIQSTSRALMEEVSFDRTSVTAREWGAYPIIKFPEVPEIDVSDAAAAGSAAARRRQVRLCPQRGRHRQRDLSMRPVCAFANCRSRRNASCRDCAARNSQRRKRCRAPASTPPVFVRARWHSPFADPARRDCNRRRPVRRRGRHRRRRAAVAIDRANRASGCIGLFGRDHRPRPATCSARRLRGVPHLRQRRPQRRRAAACKRRSARSTRPTSRPMSKPASARGPIPPSSARCAKASIATAGISIRRFPIRISPEPPTPTCRRSMPI